MPEWKRSTRKFDRYESQAAPTTRQPSAFAPEDNTGEALQKVGNQVGNAIQESSIKWTNAVDTIQKTTAQANFKSGMLDVLQRAENDPNYNNSDQYFKEIEKLKTDNLKGFASKTAETEMALNLGFEARNAQIQVENLYKKKMIDVGQASTLNLLDMEVKNPSPDLENRISKVLGAQIQAGIFDHKTAYELQKKYVKEGKYNAFLSDVNGDPGAVDEKLKSNAYGFDVTELEKAKSFFDKTQARQEEERKNFQMATVNDFGQKLANRTLKQDEIQEAVINGAIDAEIGALFDVASGGPDKWKEYVGSGKDKKELSTRAEAFTKSLDNLSRTEDLEKRVNVVKSALQNYNDKKIDRDDLAFILRVANGKSAEPQNPIWGFLKAATDMVPMPTQFGAKVMDKFKSRWDFKTDPRFVMQQAAIDQFKEDKPETASYEIGDVIKRKSGSYEVVGYNEDGSPVFRKK